MQKNIIIFSILIVIAFIIGWVAKPGTNNKDIEERIGRIEELSNSIIDSQRKSQEQIKLIGTAVDRIRAEAANISNGIARTEKRSDRLESGINKLEQLNSNNIEAIRILAEGNSKSEELSESIRSIGEGIGGIITAIEERNK